MTYAEFCPDCGRDRTPSMSEMTSFTADPSWTAEFAKRLADGQQPMNGETVTTAADGSRWRTWTEPVIGWAVVLKHFKNAMYDGHETRIEPVLLAEGAFPQPMSEYEEERNMTGVHTRFVRRDGAP